MNQFGHWITGGVPSRAWLRERITVGSTTSVTMVEKDSILAEARRRLLLEEREALIQIEMAKLRLGAKESRPSR